MNNWEKLCAQVTPLISGGVNEAVFNKSFLSCLRTIFNWGSDNLKAEYPVQMGSTTKRADVILTGGDFSIVIEMKHPDKVLGSDHAGQLFSYMRILGYKYGLLVGSEIKLFYDCDHNEIKEIVSLNFNANNKDGIELGDLLDSTTCSDNKLDEYCKLKIENLKKLRLTKEPGLENGTVKPGVKGGSNKEKRLERLYEIKAYFEEHNIPVQKPHQSRFYMGLRHGEGCGLPSGRFGFVIAVLGNGTVTCDWQNGGVERYDSNWFEEKKKIINSRHPELIVSIRKSEHTGYIYMAITVDQKKLPDDLLSIFNKTKGIMLS
jgi:hypothetical protein